jgi:DNA polymerase-1
MSQNILVLDTEETILAKGDPFHADNKLVCITWATPRICSGIWWIEHEQLEVHSGVLQTVREKVESASTIVGFNLKRDLHWLRRYGLYDPYAGQKLYDCQVAEFLLGSQREKYPSLDGCCKRYGIDLPESPVPGMWKLGIDTNHIDMEILGPYAINDARATHSLFQMQQEAILDRSRQFQTLMDLEMEDLKVIMEMEWNGVKFNLDAMKQEGQKLQQEIEAMTHEVSDLVGGVPVDLNSPDCKSAILFGGKVSHSYKVENGTYKGGAKAGQVKMSWKTDVYDMPQLAKPKKKLKKPGLFATDYDTLKSLRVGGKAKRLRDLIIARADSEKLRGTYLQGIPAKAAEMGWTDNIIHGKYNQVVAVTGRLSSSEPNLQNLDPRVEQYIESRYVD